MLTQLLVVFYQGGKPKKSKAEKRRAKVTGPSVLESLSFPPLESSEVLVPDFGKLQQEDPTLSSSFASVKTPDEAKEAINEGDVCFFKHFSFGKLSRVSSDKQLVVPEAQSVTSWA